MDITIRQASVSEIDKLLEWRMEVLRNVFGISETNNVPQHFHSPFQELVYLADRGLSDSNIHLSNAAFLHNYR